MRLIDADALKKEFPKDTDWEYPTNTNEYVCEKIDAQPTVQPETNCSEFPNNSDTISRQQSIDALRKMQTYKLGAGDDMLLIDQAEAQTELMMLPSAQPEPRTAYWTKDIVGSVICSNCGGIREDNRIGHTQWCNCCGCFMRGE